jgi:hypothetical protein
LGVTGKRMRLAEFAIGLEFWCGGKRWRCTDIGTRVVVAISLESHEVASLEIDPNDGSKRTKRRNITDDDPSWFNGLPYAIVEHVFDEYDLKGCWMEPNDDPAFSRC